MHYFQKTYYFLSFFNGATSILSDILITLRKSHEIILWGIFEKSEILARDVFEMPQRCHRTDIFFQISLRRLKDISQKKHLFIHFWGVLKASQKSYQFWGVSEKSLRCLSQLRSDWDFSRSSHASCGGKVYWIFH